MANAPYNNVTRMGAYWADPQGNLYDDGGNFVGTSSNGVTASRSNSPMSGAQGALGSNYSMNAGLGTGLQGLQDAINSGNQKQYDLAVGQLMGIFNGKPTEQYLKDYGQFASGLINQAAQLRGPKNYMDYIQQTGAGKNLGNQLYGSPRPAFSSPTSPLTPYTIEDMLNDLGIGSGKPTVSTSGAATASGAGGGGLMDASQGKDGKYQVGGGGNGTYSATDEYGGIMPEGFSEYSGSGVPSGSGANGLYLYRGQNPYAQTTDYGKLSNIWSQYLNGDLGQASGVAGYASGLNSGNLLPTLQNSMQAAYNNQDWTKSDTSNYSSATPGYAANAQNDPSGSMTKFFQDILSPQNRGRWVNMGQTDQNSAINNQIQGLLGQVGSATSDSIPSKDVADPADVAMYGMTDNQGNFWKVYQGANGSTYKVPVSWQINPNHINAVNWDAMGDTGRSLVESLAGKQGWDMSDFENQINAQRPVGAPTAAGSTQTRYAPLGAV